MFSLTSTRTGGSDTPDLGRAQVREGIILNLHLVDDPRIGRSRGPSRKEG